MLARKSLREVWGESLVELGAKNPDILVLDGDLANSTRADLFADALPDRFFQMGIAEQNMVGMAAGLATLGFIPFLSTFVAFAAYRDLDQIRVVVAQPSLNVIICGAYSGLLTGKTGKTHQDFSDIAIFRSMPNMTVIAPADAVELRKIMGQLVDHPRPAYLRLTRDPSPVIFDESYDFEIGKGVFLREGRDVAIISTGVQTTRCLEACDILEAQGTHPLLLHLPTLKPIDQAAIIRAARETGRVVTAEDHSVIGGLGGAVAEVLSECFPIPVKRVGIRDVFGESAPNEPLLEKYGLTSRHVVTAVKEQIGGK